MRSKPPTRIPVLVVATAAAAGLVACSNDTGDFQAEAEDFINEDGDEGLAATLEDQTGEPVDFSDADCTEPGNTETDTRYTCTATEAGGDTWDFVVEISGDSELTVVEAAARA